MDPFTSTRKGKDDHLEPTYNSYVLIQDVALKTYLKRWMVEKGSGRGSGISLLMGRHDDDDDDNEYLKQCIKFSLFLLQIIYSFQSFSHQC